MVYTIDDTGAYKSAFERVDVLTLLDPHWVENTQADKLAKMVADARDAGEFDDLSCGVNRLVA